jgi:hypothetical protein
MDQSSGAGIFTLGASTSVRTGNRVNGRGEESSGSLLLFELDLDRLAASVLGELSIPMSPHFPKRNSVRGFCEFAGGIAVCNCSQAFLFDRQLRLLRTYSENTMGDIHSVATDGETLYVTATGADAVIGLDWNFEKVFSWHASRSALLRPHLKLRPVPPRFLEAHEFRRDLHGNHESFHINHLTFSRDGDLLCNLPKIGRVFNITQDDFFLPCSLYPGNGTTHDGLDAGEYYYLTGTGVGEVLKVSVPTGRVAASVSCSQPVSNSTGARSAEKHGWLRGSVHLGNEIFALGQIGPTIKIVDMKLPRLIASVRLSEVPNAGESIYCLNRLSCVFIPAFKRLRRLRQGVDDDGPVSSPEPAPRRRWPGQAGIPKESPPAAGPRNGASSLTLVTAASSNHFHCLKNLLHSLSVFESETHAIVFDLGLGPAELEELQRGNCDVRRFPFEQYPPHLNITRHAGQYAWKPVIVADTLRETNGMVLWMDAGNLVLGSLDRIRSELARQGIYCPRSSGDIRKWTHPDTLRYLGASPSLLSHVNRNAAFVGLNAASPGARELAERWKVCALEVNCIAPSGSNRKNHRQDQAVLTILIYQFRDKYGWVLENEELDVSAHNDKLTLEQVSQLISPRMTPATKSTREREAIDFLLRQEMVFCLAGQCRRMSFLPDGRVGKGAGPGEKYWDLVTRDGLLCLDFFSKEDLTGTLQPNESRGWLGTLAGPDPIPVELVTFPAAATGAPPE